MELQLIQKKAIKRGRNYLSIYQCECGNIKYYRACDVKRVPYISCGCSTLLKMKQIYVTHGQSKTPTYVSWRQMKQRCRNVNCTSYTRYGGKGITVCDRWNRFEIFLEDMGPRPSVDYCIDRIDATKGYMPSNCRWVTKSENSKEARSRDNANI